MSAKRDTIVCRVASGTGPRSRSYTAVLVGVISCLAMLHGPDQARGADVVVVCPSSFRESLDPWLDHRRGEGMSVDVVDSQPDSMTLRRSIAKAADRRTTYVMLVGDAPVIGTRCDATRNVPVFYFPTKVTASWGSTSTMSSDLLYGDFDRDGAPDAVVGRLPVDTNDQLKKLIERIIAYDNSDDFGPWRGNVQLTGGIGGFGVIADAAIESVARTVVTTVLPIETRTSVIHASPGHIFYPQGDSFTDAVLGRYRDGSRFWVYAGHGFITELDCVPQSEEGRPVLDASSVQQLSRPASSAPIAIILACFTGAIDAPDDSLSEQMVLTEGGPIAVLAGSRVTMPYGNTAAAVGLIEGVFEQKLPRLGDAWLNSLRQLYDEDSSRSSSTRLLIDTLATVVSPAGTDLLDERREHMRLYNLIGDPTLRMHHPLPVSMEVARGHEPGQPIMVQLESPINGRLQLSFDRPLGAVTEGDPNATTVASLETEIEANQPARPRVVLPAGVTGPIVIRAIVSGKSNWASAAARTLLRSNSR